MTKNHKFMLSMAAIAILSGTSLQAVEIEAKNGNNWIWVGDYVTDNQGVESAKATKAELKDDKASLNNNYYNISSGYASGITSATVTGTGKDASSRGNLNINKDVSIGTLTLNKYATISYKGRWGNADFNCPDGICATLSVGNLIINGETGGSNGDISLGKINATNTKVTGKVTVKTGVGVDKTNQPLVAANVNFGNLGVDNGELSLEVGENAKAEANNITLINNSSFSASGKQKTFDINSISADSTSGFTLGGNTFNLANGLKAEKGENIKISAGGTINFNGGLSEIKGKLTTTENTATTLDVNQNAGVTFEELDLKKSSVLSLDGGTINVGKLTTAEKDNLSLSKGTLNFIGKLDETGEMQTQKSSLTGFAESLASSEAIINFNNGSEVTIISAGATAVDLDLSATKANVNFYNGSLVKLGKDSTGTLTAGAGKSLYLGGQVELGTLKVATSTDSSLLNIGFGTANVSLSGKLVGKNTTQETTKNTNPAKFTIGTDKDGNSIIGASGEQVEIGEANTNSALTLKAGVVSTNATLTTATNSKLIFGGGSLNIGAGGSLTITDTSKNLEFKDGVGGWITLAGDSTKGGEMTISKGDLDLSNTFMGINIEQGGKLVISASGAGVIGSGNAISLTKFADITINGKISGTSNGITFGGTDAYKVSGDLTLGKDTILGIVTRTDNDGNLKEVEVGKLATEQKDTKYTTATLAFGNGGAVRLTGATTDTSLKLNNLGFADKLTLADKSVLEFNSGTVNVKGALGIETDSSRSNTSTKTATLKVSNARANLNGGFDSTNYVKTIELNSGALNIKQDSFTASNLDVTHIQTNSSGISSIMNIDGEATITSSKFAILPLVETGATSYQVLSTTKGLTISDLNDKTTGEFRTRNSLNAILNKYGLSVSDASKIKDANKVISAKDSSVNTWLRDDGKNLFLERQLTNLSSLSAVKESKIQADIDLISAMNSDKDIVGADSSDSSKANTNVLDSVINNLTALKTTATKQSNKELATEMGGAHSDILLSAFGVNSGATSTQTRNAIILDIMETGGTGIVTDIKEGASSSSNMSSSTSSVMNTINLSNDMSISGRIAAANNPFANYASYDGLLYAALESDLPLYYANNGYTNGFWANAIAGQNKVEGESGTLMGLSVGFDKQLENTLVGFYLSYAVAGLNDKMVEQGSDNIQVGVYTSFNQRDIEVNVKAYGQLAVTETTAKRAKGEAEATFNRLYGGISANIGSIFAFNKNSTFVKPYIGENYYYAHTPAYEETLTSDTPLSVKSANNHALSFDVGVDVRQYWNQNSFVYITPSVERYVVNSGGDYTAGFIGSDTTFTIEGKSKTKTYIQVLLGGNISLNDQFNVNVGLGVKKIINGQIERSNGDKVDELYLSGNLGVKYRF